MITGAVTVDLSITPSADADYNLDRRRLAILEHCPDGARVVVNIGPREYVTQEAADRLHEHDHRLQIEIHGEDPWAVTKFVRAARAGFWAVAG